MKRLFDIIYSSLAIILFLPIGIPVAIILKLTDEKEVFYVQNRIGKNEKEFGLIKFVTMIKNSPKLGAGDITLKNDPRVLPFGKILRKIKLNEFPQFLNVFHGSMSMVGPRPLVEKQYFMYREKDRKKKKLKPGITGIGSIIFRDEEKYLSNSKQYSQKFYRNEIIPFKAKLEVWYYDNKSIVTDHFLLIITVINVMLPNLKIHNILLRNLPRHKIFN